MAHSKKAGRPKAAKNSTISPWLSGKIDNREGRFIQVGNSLFFNESFQALTDGDRFCYFCLCMECGGKQSFTFPGRAMLKYGISTRSGRRHIENLIEKGFIVCESSGQNTRSDNIYRFAYDWK